MLSASTRPRLHHLVAAETRFLQSCQPFLARPLDLSCRYGFSFTGAWPKYIIGVCHVSGGHYLELLTQPRDGSITLQVARFAGTAVSWGVSKAAWVKMSPTRR